MLQNRKNIKLFYFLYLALHKRFKFSQLNIVEMREHFITKVTVRFKDWMCYCVYWSVKVCASKDKSVCVCVCSCVHQRGRACVSLTTPEVSPITVLWPTGTKFHRLQLRIEKEYDRRSMLSLFFIYQFVCFLSFLSFYTSNSLSKLST